ncbi:MAG: hypothetical protein AAF587_29610 [Bacteroidota bacterium]
MPTLSTFLESSVIVALIYGAVELWKHRQKTKKAVSKAILKSEYLLQLLELFRVETKVDRVLYMISENGGGIPKPHKQLYVSIIHESVSMRLPSIKIDWQKQPIDNFYMKQLAEMVQTGSNTMKVSELQDGILKNVYEAQGVATAFIGTIKDNDGSFLSYIACQSTDSNFNFQSPSFKEAFRAFKLKASKL